MQKIYGFLFLNTIYLSYKSIKYDTNMEEYITIKNLITSEYFTISYLFINILLNDCQISFISVWEIQPKYL